MALNKTLQKQYHNMQNQGPLRIHHEKLVTKEKE